MTDRKSIRLVYPQWEGGANPPYYVGARLLNWLAPRSVDRHNVFTVPVCPPKKTAQLRVENGMTARSRVTNNVREALKILEREAPDTVVTFGGDCGVSLAPFAYLSSHYAEETFGILWIDSHPDVTANVEGFDRAHMFVLANLMGKGDAELVSTVHHPIAAPRVLIAGIHGALPHEEEFIKSHKITALSPEEVKANGAAKILEWIKREKITKLAVHLDLDVVNPKSLRSVIFSMPNSPPNYMDGVAQGKLELHEISRVLNDVSGSTDIVGLTVAEFFPWDVINLRHFMQGVPLLRDPRKISKL